MNNDLISREALKEEITSYDREFAPDWVLNLIDNAPTVETERPKGEWIDRMADKGYVECPFCHKQITGGDLNFCVKCGADMKGGAV